MTGYRTKTRFRGGLLPYIAAIKGEDTKPDMIEIERRAVIVLDDSVTEVSVLPSIDFKNLINRESAGILGKTIVGKEDIPIAALITRLGISDWVEQGQRHIEGDVCPFCQQHTVTDTLEVDFEAFFDETYKSDKDELRNASQRYADGADGIIDALKGITETHADFLNVHALQARIAELDSLLRVSLETCFSFWAATNSATNNPEKSTFF